MSAKEIAKKYLAAIDAKDYDLARQYLADDLSFVGPIDTFHSADAYLGALKKLGTMVERIDIKAILAEGHEVGVFCDLIMKPPAPPSSFVAEWYQIKGERITSVRVVFDARPFAAMFAKK